MWASTMEQARELVNNPMFGYARWDYRLRAYMVYNNTENRNGPARGRRFAGAGPIGLIERALKEKRQAATSSDS